jgi:elongation factor P
VIVTSDFKRGLAILVEGKPYIITDYSVQTPSARGAATLVRVKARNVLTGQVLDMTFKSGDKFDEPDLEFRKTSFLYADGDEYHFMDETNGRCYGVELPQFVEFEVTETGPGGRSDMASGKVTKPATLSNGTEIRVPVYLEAGEKVMVDTTTGEFVRRVSDK